MNARQEQAKAYDPSEAEKAVIGACLVKPDLIAEISARLQHGDFEDRFHGIVFEIIHRLYEQGRKPSVESIIAEIGNDELEPNLTPRQYLTELVRAQVVGQFLPWQDGVGVVLEASQRRVASSVGFSLVAASNALGTDLREATTVAIEGLDNVLSTLRPQKRRVYDGVGAAELAMAYLDSDAERDPTTGLTDLDEVLGGWPRGQLSVVAARPGMGKSALAVGSALRTAKAGNGVAMFSLEMTGEQIGARLMTDVCYSREHPVHYDAIHKRTVDDRTRQKLEWARGQLAGLPLLIEEQRGLTMSEVAARTRKMANTFARDGKRLDVVIVDHMLLIQPSQRYAGNRVREVAEISGGLATLAKELNVAVVALCQLNRGVEGRDDKHPTLADLRDSGAIEEDASTVTFLYRPVYYLERQRFDDMDSEIARQAAVETMKHRLEIMVSKNRNGQNRTIEAFVDIGANAIRNGAYGR